MDKGLARSTPQWVVELPVGLGGPQFAIDIQQMKQFAHKRNLICCRARGHALIPPYKDDIWTSGSRVSSPVENRFCPEYTRSRLCQAWWRHQMETFSALLALWEGISSVAGEFPSQRPVTRNFGVFFDLHLNKQLSKPSRRWWFETPSPSLWCHCNEVWDTLRLCLMSLPFNQKMLRIRLWYVGVEDTFLKLK